MPGEYVVPVPPLELPPGMEENRWRSSNRTKQSCCSSERAAAASGAFELTDLEPGRCRLPVPAARWPAAGHRARRGQNAVLSVEQILARLSDRFALLTGGGRAALPRHQTLRMAIDWSFDQLTEAEQVLMRRLCVFAAHFTLEDVAGVCTADDATGSETLDLLDVAG